MTLKVYNSVAKTSKLKVKKFSGLIPVFRDITRKKLFEWALWSVPNPK